MWTSAGAPEHLLTAHDGASGLLGRERESAALRELMAGHRLVTVTGAAGMGKSRLAVAATDAAPERPLRPTARNRRVVRVRWHGGEPAEAGTLVAAVLRALTGTAPGREAPGIGEIAADRRAGNVLLLLDDVDPVRAECTRLVQHLLMAVPGLRVLVTSRCALGLGEEGVLRLSPLGVEAPGAPAPPASPASPAGPVGPAGPAVELFVTRARAVPGFRCTDAELPLVAEICRLVEGVPLAVELAAQQVAYYSLGELARLLACRQRWLNSPLPRLRRHRSMEDAIGTSYALCDRETRVVWARASVFAGSFAEGTAGFLCTGTDVPPHRVAAGLARLASCGVLEVLGDPGGVRAPRYRMPRAAREFGAAKLQQAGEYPAVAERRSIHWRRTASAFAHMWSGGGQDRAVELVREARADLTATVRYALTEPDHAEAALETVVDLWFWWAVHGRAEEGRDYLLRLLPLCRPGRALTARGLALAAWLSASSDPRSARILLGRAWSVAVLSGEDATVGRIAYVQGMLDLYQRDARAAAGHFRYAAETIPPHAPGGPSPVVARAVLALAQAGFAPAAARRTARRALRDPGIRDDAWATLLARYALALADHRLGHNGRAWRRAHRALTASGTRYPAPHVCASLRRLVADIGAGVPALPQLPSMPIPDAPVPPSVSAAGRSLR